MSQTRTTAVATTVVAVAATLAILYLGRSVLVPIALAIAFALALRPVVQWFEARRVPAPAATGLLLLAGLLLFASIGAILIEPAKQFAAKAPEALASAARKLAPIQRRLSNLGGSAPAVSRDSADTTQHQPADSTRSDSTRSDSTRADSAQKQPTQDGGTSGSSLGPIVARLFGTTGDIIALILETSLLLFFLLAAGDAWSKRLKAAASSAASANNALKITEEIQQVVSRYLFATLLINLAQGLVVGIAMALVGMPAAILWGLFTVVAEFIPYAGGMVMVGLLALTGLAAGSGIGHALIGPALYIVITTVQNNVVSPLVYGKGLKLNPAAILVGVMVWFFLWGVPGAFLAVPLLASIKVFCDHTDELTGLGKFLEG